MDRFELKSDSLSDVDGGRNSIVKFCTCCEGNSEGGEVIHVKRLHVYANVVMEGADVKFWRQ
ncbi:hypothetical protein Goshw_015041, partial [Gossypium schwendimanii]|nr:hypothetical protein [Gossypium schwendimanii]